MSKTIAIFGAGTGLGTALARRFAQEDFKVALVARNAERLNTLVDDFSAEGIEAAAFPTDLYEPEKARATVDAIKARFGSLDVLSYQPLNSSTGFVPAKDLDRGTLSEYINLLLLSPVEIISTVLPDMLASGDGGIFVTGGFTAADPQPHISGIGPAMSAMRNFIYSLNGEVAASGIYAGVVTLAAMIKDSEAYNRISPEMLAEITGGTTGMQILDPDELAETYWQLYTKRDQVEYRFPAPKAN